MKKLGNVFMYKYIISQFISIVKRKLFELFEIIRNNNGYRVKTIEHS